MMKYLKVYSNKYQPPNVFITKARKHENTKKILKFHAFRLSCFIPVGMLRA